MRVGWICESAIVMQIITQVAAFLMFTTVFLGQSGETFQDHHFSPFIGPSSVAHSFSFFNHKNKQIHTEPYGEALDLVPLASTQQNISTVVPPPTPDTYSTNPESVPPTTADFPNQTHPPAAASGNQSSSFCTTYVLCTSSP